MRTGRPGIGRSGERGLGAESAGGLALEAESEPKAHIARADKYRYARP